MVAWPLRHKVPDFELGRLVRASTEAEAVKAELLAGLQDLTPERREEVAHRCWSSILRDYLHTVCVHSKRLVADARSVSGGRSDDDHDGADDLQPCSLVQRLEQRMAEYVRHVADTLGVGPDTLADALARELTSLLHPLLRDLSAAFIVGRLASPSGRLAGLVGGSGDEDVFE